MAPRGQDWVRSYPGCHTVPVSERHQERQPGPLAPLSERNYRWFFFGNISSNLGTFCQTIAQSLLVYRLTESTFLVGVVNFAQFAAVPLLAPVAGSLADRYDRRKVLIGAQVYKCPLWTV